MAITETSTPETFFAGNPTAYATFAKVHSTLGRLGPFDVRVSKSQVAFRRSRGFAYLWMPGPYLSSPKADVVLSIALKRREASKRFKEVAHPAPGRWMHHLEIQDPGDIDDEVTGWLREASDEAV